MRPGLLPGLVTAAQRNRDRGFADGALFELGQAYRGPLPEDQFVAAAGVRFGRSALQAQAATGPAKRPKRMCSPPRPMQSRRLPPSASTRAISP